MNLPVNLINLQRLTAFFLAASVSLITSCSLISNYDQKSYENATSLKVDTKNVMGLATESYSSHTTDIGTLITNLDKAYEYDFSRPKNDITIRLWDKLRNPDGALLGGFLAEWKTEGRLLPGYVRSKQTQIGRGFDMISGLESGKLKPSDVE